MKNNPHKILSLLAAGLMSASLLGVTGCGPASNPGPKGPDGETPGERLRVSLLYPWSGFLQSSDEPTDPSSPFYDERWKLIMDKFNISLDYMVADSATMRISCGRRSGRTTCRTWPWPWAWRPGNSACTRPRTA